MWIWPYDHKNLHKLFDPPIDSKLRLYASKEGILGIDDNSIWFWSDKLVFCIKEGKVTYESKSSFISNKERSYRGGLISETKFSTLGFSHKLYFSPTHRTIPGKYRRILQKTFIEAVPIYGDKAVIRGEKYPSSFLDSAFRVRRKGGIGEIELTLEEIIVDPSLQSLLRQYKELCEKEGIKFPQVLPENCLVPSGLPVEVIMNSPYEPKTLDQLLEDDSSSYWVYARGTLYNLQSGRMKKVKKGRIVEISPGYVSYYKTRGGKVTRKVSVKYPPKRTKQKFPSNGIGQNLLLMSEGKLKTPSGVFDVYQTPLTLEITTSKVHGIRFFDVVSKEKPHDRVIRFGDVIWVVPADLKIEVEQVKEK